jgi:DNA-binding XRE family transcriptional regulator
MQEKKQRLRLYCRYVIDMIENIVAEYSAQNYSRTMKGIGERVKRYRRDKGLSQKDLADKAGINIETVVRLEAGISVGLRILYAIADALDKKIGALISRLG